MWLAEDSVVTAMIELHRLSVHNQTDINSANPDSFGRVGPLRHPSLPAIKLKTANGNESCREQHFPVRNKFTKQP